MIIVGIDIGGTKCATVIAHIEKEQITLLNRVEIKTIGKPEDVIDKLILNIKGQLRELNLEHTEIKQIGISCGGPLDSIKGIIQSPPNLKGWDNIPICDIVTRELSAPCKLKNDADASAIAEWQFGAAKGFKNAIFITFGTGLGAGLILNGQLYSGGSGSAGEIGHIRLAQDGPIGYGKKGSFEGYCSGGGIHQQIESFVELKKSQGQNKPWFTQQNISAKELSKLASAGDGVAIELFEIIGRNLGKGLSIIIDILNPDIIVLGGIYMRSHEYMDQSMYEVLKEEVIESSLSHVLIKPSKLGEQIGDYASLCASLY